MAMTDTVALGLPHYNSTLQIVSEVSRVLFSKGNSNQNATGSLRDSEWDAEQGSGDGRIDPDSGAMFILFIAAIIIFACCLCLLNLSRLPSNLSGDEISIETNRSRLSRIELLRILDSSNVSRRVLVRVRDQEIFESQRREFVEKSLQTKIYTPSSGDIENGGGTENVVPDDADDTVSDEDHQCAICLAKYVQGDEVAYSYHECHIFHKDCIASWLLHKDDCPCCRRKFLIPTGGRNGSADEELGQNDDSEVATNSETLSNTLARPYGIQLYEV